MGWEPREHRMSGKPETPCRISGLLCNSTVHKSSTCSQSGTAQQDDTEDLFVCDQSACNGSHYHKFDIISDLIACTYVGKQLP